MQPDTIRASRPVPRVHRPEHAAAVVTAPGSGAKEELGDRSWVSWIGCYFLAGMTTLDAISGFSIRPSVQTRMAVGQVRVFLSVRSRRLDGSKIARSAHYIGIWTLGRIERPRLMRRGILTREIGRPYLLEVDPGVSLGVFAAGDVHRLRDDAER